MKTESKKAQKARWNLQSLVVDRAQKELGVKDRQSLMMDLDSVPDANLDLLLTFPAFDFTHDICGIMRHMDRSEYPGKLKNCFVPRCCRATKATGGAK